MAIVYVHKQLDGTPFYVGAGKDRNRANAKADRTDCWKEIANKGYNIEILFDNLTLDEARQMERLVILIIGRKDLNQGPLINRTDGGDNIMDDEARLRHSELFKGRIFSKEWREKLSAANRGKKASEETRAKLREARKNYKHSEETKQKLKDAFKLRRELNIPRKKQKPITEEHRMKLKEAGLKNWAKRKEQMNNNHQPNAA